MLLLFDDYCHAKNLRYHLIAFRDIDNQRILQSNWLRAFYAITGKPDFFQKGAFCRIMKYTVMHYF